LAVVALALGGLVAVTVVLMALDLRARWRSEIRPRWTDDGTDDDTTPPPMS